MRKVHRNPLAATDPCAVPYLSGSTWWDFGFGPLCRRLLTKYGIPLPTGHREPTTTHGDDAARLFSRTGAADRIAPGDGSYPPSPGATSRTVCEVEIEPGFVLKIDEPDWHVFLSRPWYLSTSKRSDKRYLANKRSTGMTYLHRLITGAPSGDEVDHINDDSLDNRRTNLRVVTHAQNAQNVPSARKNSKTGVRGVSWSRSGNCYRVDLTTNGYHRWIGNFNSLDEAREAYAEARRTYHTHAPQGPPPLTREIILARLAENPRTSCADCGCEEGCIAYLRALLAEIDAPNPCIDYHRDAPTGAAATGAGGER